MREAIEASFGSDLSLNSLSSTKSIAQKSSDEPLILFQPFQSSKAALCSIPTVSSPLSDKINIEEICEAFMVGFGDLTSRTKLRIQNEQHILECLSRQLSTIDVLLRAVPIGSSTYGFGGSNTNFNVLINAGKKSVLMNITIFLKKLHFSTLFSSRNFRFQLNPIRRRLLCHIHWKNYLRSRNFKQISRYCLPLMGIGCANDNFQ